MVQWWIWLNMYILRPTAVHNRYGKWISSVLFAQLMAESAHTLQWAPLSARTAPSHRDLDLPCNTWCCRPIRVHNPNGTSIGSAVFAQITAGRGVSLYFTMVCLFSLKIAPFHVGIWTSCNTWFIGSTRVRSANGNLIVSAISAGLTDWQSDRKTDRPRYSVRCGVMMRNYVGYSKAAIVWLWCYICRSGIPPKDRYARTY